MYVDSKEQYIKDGGILAAEPTKPKPQEPIVKDNK